MRQENMVRWFYAVLITLVVLGIGGGFLLAHAGRWPLVLGILVLVTFPGSLVVLKILYKILLGTPPAGLFWVYWWLPFVAALWLGAIGTWMIRVS
jgi:hypothetical protein